ncbi:MAG: hypothetical protein KF814_00645 [Nitrospiraceae bacterium]|nr:hypothetical protein [Nitrospiraceae bacterium]
MVSPVVTTSPLRRRVRVRHLAFAICLAILLQTAWCFAGTVTVDLSKDEGPITHRANGYLVSLQADAPAAELIQPLKPTSFRGSPGYIFANYARLRELGVDEFQLTLGLVFADYAQWIFDINRIGEQGDYGPWLAHVNRVIDVVQARKLNVLWDIYNEPDLAFPPIGENPKLKTGWKLAYELIKRRIPGARIVGPSISRYRLLKPFLDWSRDERVFPDIVAYHEYDDPAGAQTLIDDLRRYLQEKGLTAPISVNEIIGQETWTQPGYVAAVLAAYERAGILSAMHACWPDAQDTSRDQVENTCDNPTLDGLLFVDRQSARPGWHVYQTYAAMEGHRLQATSDRPGLHVLAADDRRADQVRLLLGKFQAHDEEETLVVLRQVSQRWPGNQGLPIDICGEVIPDVGSAPLERPVRRLAMRAVPAGDALLFSLPEFGRADAYRITIGRTGNCAAAGMPRPHSP